MSEDRSSQGRGKGNFHSQRCTSCPMFWDRADRKQTMNGRVVYRQQLTRCGKQRCRKCKEGEGHGPYWYAYWSEKGRTVSKYIGAHLPDDMALPPGAPAPHDEAPQSTAQPQISAPILRVYLLGQFRIERRNGSEWS